MPTRVRVTLARDRQRTLDELRAENARLRERVSALQRSQKSSSEVLAQHYGKAMRELVLRDGLTMSYGSSAASEVTIAMAHPVAVAFARGLQEG